MKIKHTVSRVAFFSKIVWKVLSNNIFWFAVFFTGVTVAFFILSANFVKTKTKYFSIKKVEFDGNDHVPDILLLKASGIKYNSNIFAYSLKDIKERLERKSWVRSVVVQRKLPNKIYIRIAERVPIAILQTNNKLHLIDSDGKVLEHDGIGNFNNLPIIVGENAGPSTPAFLENLEKFPKIRRQLVFAIWVGNRRWNMRLNHNVLVKMPEGGLSQALCILNEITDSNGCFNENIEIVDLRLLDRVIITKKNEQKT